MQITKSNKKQLKQSQPQPDQKSAKMFKVGMFRVSKWKLVVVAVAACLVAALIARCSTSKSEIEETKHQLNDKLKLVREEQKLVREYVRSVLGKIGAATEAARVGQFEEHLFAKTVLNAYDRPYEQVVAAINKLQDELGRVGQPEAAANSGASKATGGAGRGSEQQQQEEAQRLLVEAYGRALEESQKHSVLIQNEIRRQQERVPNANGKQSKNEATLRVWPLNQLAQFEARLLESYLDEALRVKSDA